MEKSIKFTAEGRTTFRSLHIGIQKEIKSVLKQLARAEIKGKALTGQLTGFSTLRVGNHRVIYSESADMIIVHRTDHREDVYNKRVSDK